MHNLASKLAALRLVEPDVAVMVERDSRAAVLGTSNTFADAARVKADHRAAALEIRRIRAESRRRWHERGEVPAALTPRKGPAPRYYRPDHAYKVGEEIRCDSFGDGEVIAVERRRITVRFAEGERILAVSA